MAPILYLQFFRRRAAKVESKATEIKRRMHYLALGFAIPIINVVLAHLIEWR